MDWWQVIGTILAVSLLVVLLFVGINPLKAVYETFRSFGGEESGDVTYLKQLCNDKYEEGCALEIAQKLVESGGSLFEVQSWLKKEAENSNTQPILSDCFDFAKNTFYVKWTDYRGAAEIYGLLSSKISDPALKKAAQEQELISDVHAKVQDIRTCYSLIKPDGLVQTDELNKIKSCSMTGNLNFEQTLNFVVSRYDESKNLLGDIQILGNPADKSVCSIGGSLGLEGCNEYARASLRFPCYVSNVRGNEFGTTYICSSCYHYSGTSEKIPVYLEGVGLTEQNIPNPCGGYHDEATCIANPCHGVTLGVACKWDGNKCIMAS